MWNKTTTACCQSSNCLTSCGFFYFTVQTAKRQMRYWSHALGKAVSLCWKTNREKEIWGSEVEERGMLGIRREARPLKGGRQEGKNDEESSMEKSDKCRRCTLVLSSYQGSENRSTASHLAPIDWPTGNPYYSCCLAGCGYGLDTTDPWEIIGCTPLQ